MESVRVHIDHRGTVKLSTLTLSGWVELAFAETLEFSLSDPEFQWEFANNFPSPLAPPGRSSAHQH